MPQNLLPIPDFRSSVAPTPEQIAEYERYVAEQQANDPLWKKLGRGALGATAGAFKGLFGLEPPEGLLQNNPEVAGNVFSQVLQAGLPFWAITKGRPVFHGTTKVFDRFDPSKNDVEDVLGWMTHFAERPSYANDYSTGVIKGSTGKANMIAAKPQAQNTLDLVDPNPDDIAAALAAVPEWHRKELLSAFKDTRRQVREGGDKYRYLGERHYRDEGYPEDAQLPIQTVAEKLRMGPEDFDKTLFDAIRYRDMGNISWAVPEKTPIQTAWGLPMTNDPKPLEMLKLPDNAPIKSELQVQTGSKYFDAPKHTSILDIKPKPKGQYDYSDGGESIKLTPEEWADKLQPIHPKPKPGGGWIIDKNNPELPTIFGKPVNLKALEELYVNGYVDFDDFKLLKTKFFTGQKSEYSNLIYVDKDNPQLPVVKGKPVNGKELKDLYFDGQLDSADYKLLKDKYFSFEQAEKESKVIADAIKNQKLLGPLTEEALNKIAVFDTKVQSGISAVFDDLVDALDYMDAHPGTDWNTVKSFIANGYN